MSPPADSTRQIVLRTAETLLIAGAGGIVFTLAGFPAGLISGSLLSVAAAGLMGRPVIVPRRLTQVISVLVGISLGAVVTPETLEGLAAFPVSIAVLLVATVCMTAATTCYLRAVHRWDWQSALFGASPGALAQIMVLSNEYRLDIRAIAIVQVMRVVVLTIGIPTGLALFGLTATGVMLPRSAAVDASVIEIAILIVVSTAVAVGLLAIRFPGGLIFGAMMGSAVLHGTGWIGASLPWWAVAAAVVGIGAVTGSRFAGTDPRTLLRYLGAALGSIGVRGDADDAAAGPHRRRGGGLCARRTGHHDGAGAGAASRPDLHRGASSCALYAGFCIGAADRSLDGSAGAARGPRDAPGRPANNRGLTTPRREPACRAAGRADPTRQAAPRRARRPVHRRDRATA